MHPQFICYGRSRRNTSVLFCFLCVYSLLKRMYTLDDQCQTAINEILRSFVLVYRLEDPSNYRPKHFFDNDTRTGILKRRQTEVLLQCVPMEARAERIDSLYDMKTEALLILYLLI